MGAFLRLQRWKWDNGLFWFQSCPPHIEFRTFLVEGKKGEGKTRYLSGYAAKQMRRGIRICSNYTIVDRLTGARSVPVTGWLDVLRYSVDALETGTPTMFIIDEFHLWADARSWSKTPEWFRGWLAQSRHYGVGLCGSVQNFKTVELRARQIVDDLVRIRKFRLGRVPLYRVEEVAPESVEAEGGYELASGSLGLFKWYAGYDTRELITVEEWKSDDELDAEVARLTARAAQLVAPGEFATFAAYEEARRADLDAAPRFDADSGEYVGNVWDDANVYELEGD